MGVPSSSRFQRAALASRADNIEHTHTMPGEVKRTVAEMEKLGLPISVLTFYKGDDDKGDTEDEKKRGVYPTSSFKIDDVKEEIFRQRRICEKLGLLGFVVLGDHGIKGVLCGPIEEIKLYVQAMGADRIFQGTKMRVVEKKQSPYTDLVIKETRFLTHKQSSDLLRISQQCGCGVGLSLAEDLRWLATDEPNQ